MKAWLMDGYRGVEALRLADVPEPAPQGGQVVLELDYASLNPADRYLSEGQYPSKPPLPHILGRDGVGTVVAAPPGDAQFKVGQKFMILRGEVGVNRPGTFAQRVAVPVDQLTPPPSDWTSQQCAAGTLVYLTAYQALTQWGDLPPSVVLITGASGGVGVASIQLGLALGHTLIGLSRDGAKRAKIESLGAAATFDPADAKWRFKCRQFLGTRRVDLAIDNIGGSLLTDVIDTLGNNGRISLVGRLAGPVPQFNTATMFFRRLKMGGVAAGAYTPAEAAQTWQQVLQLLGKTGAKPLVDSVFPMEDLPAAFARLAHGPMGKVLLQVR